MPAKKKTTKNEKDVEIVKTRMLDSSMLEMEKQDKRRGILLVIVSLLLVCSLLLNALQYIKCRKKDCKENESEPVEKIVISKTINIEGYEFSFDDKWNLNIDKDKLSLSNKDQTANFHFELNEYNYETLIKEENIKKYIEDLQVSDNVTINIYKEEIRKDSKYYYLEGTNKENYTYVNILVGKEDKTFSIKGVFENAKALEQNKSTIVDIILNAKKK